MQGGGEAARDRVRHHRLGAPRERSGICCGTSALTMPFRSVSSRQRTNLSFGTAPAFSFSFSVHTSRASPLGVVVFPNVAKGSRINTLECVRWAAFLFSCPLDGDYR